MWGTKHEACRMRCGPCGAPHRASPAATARLLLLALLLVAHAGPRGAGATKAALSNAAARAAIPVAPPSYATYLNYTEEELQVATSNKVRVLRSGNERWRPSRNMSPA